MVSTDCYSTQARHTKHETVIKLLPTLPRQSRGGADDMPVDAASEGDYSAVHRRCVAVLDTQKDTTVAFENLFGRGHLRVSHLPATQITQTEGVMGQGTKTQFGQWLSEKKHMSHTYYSGLSIEAKAAIYNEYRKKGQKASEEPVEAK